MKLSAFLILTWPVLVADSLFIDQRLIIWNVGQGSWATYFDYDTCLHFDSGGDRKPNTSLLIYCKEHQHYLSHLDWDHISYIRYLSSLGLCRNGNPKEPKRLIKQRIYEKIPECQAPSKLVNEIKVPSHFKKPNDRSRVFVLKNWALIPGDSTKKAEKHWARQLSKGIQVLLLGHHGSNTSTWSKLLKRTPELKIAIASARKKKYGHPHRKVLQRLFAHGVPALSTEDWGNIILETEKTEKFKVEASRQ